MGEIWHGAITREAFKDGQLVPLDQADEAGCDFRLYSVPRPSQQQIDEIGRELHIDPRAVARAHDKHMRARVDRFGDTRFLIIRPARYIDESEEVQFGELQMIIGPDYAVLFGRCGIFPMKDFLAGLRSRPDQLAKGPTAVQHAVMNAVVNGYEPVIMGLENDIDEIEDEVFRTDADPLRRIYELIREVIEFQRAVDPLSTLLGDLVNKRELPVDEHRFLRDVHERALHASERGATFRSLLENVLDVNLALEQKRLNEVSIAQAEQTKKISSWAAILFTPTLIAGIYGMNFNHMPELEWQYGYPFALALMIAMGLLLYGVFKRNDWL